MLIAALFAIFIIILIHELGHFGVAKLFRVKVDKFSIGFGKALWSYRAKSGTEYVIAMIPLGGYVKMADEVNAYQNKSVWIRILIALAGPVTNFLLAIVIYWVLFMGGVTHIKPIVGKVIPNSIAANAGLQPGDQILQVGGMRTPGWQRVMLAIAAHLGNRGTLYIDVLQKSSTVPQQRQLSLANWQVNPQQPELLESLGIVPFRPKIPAVVGQVLANTPAALAGLKPNDYIVAVADKRTPYWENVIGFVQKHANKTVSFTVLRDDRVRKVSVTLAKRTEGGKPYGFLGVVVRLPSLSKDLIAREQYGPLSAIKPAVAETWTLIALHVGLLKKMVLGQLSTRMLSGPISIFRAAGQASQAGFKSYLAFIAFISAVIGFINLLPIPGLDGGHLLFYVIELVIGRPVPAVVQQWALLLGIFLLIFIILQATINDLLRILL